MQKKSQGKKTGTDRRTFLRAGGMGALALLMAGLEGRESSAADVKYSKADVAKVNKRLKSSAKEREAFYADPKGYLKRHGIHVTDDMIPSRAEVEAALASKPGKVSMALGATPQSGRATAGMVILTLVLDSNATMKSAPMKTAPAKN